MTAAAPGGQRRWTSWEFDAQVRDLCRYAPRGLRLESIAFAEGRWIVRLHAPGHPNHPSIVVRFEVNEDATHDDLAIQFHLACQRWLEWVA